MLKNFMKANQTNVGPVPLRTYIISAIILILAIVTKTLPTNIMGGMAVMLIFGWLFFTIGNKLPLLRNLGGGTLLAMVLPAVLIYFSIIPPFVYETVRFTFEDVNMANFFMFSIIVGSINAISRDQLIKGMVGLFIPLFSSLLLGYTCAILIGRVLGFDFDQSFFNMIVPAMAGGVAPGIMPLAQGYSDILSMNYGHLVSILTPALILSNFFASLMASLLNMLGKKYPQLTGNGKLSQEDRPELSLDETSHCFVSTNQSLSVGLIYVISMYLISYSLSQFISLPTAVIGLTLSIIVKVFRLIPYRVENATIIFRKSFSSFFSSGILCGIGMLYFDLENVFNIITWRYLLIIFSLVMALVIVGFLSARLSGTYPIDTAVVTLNLAALGAMGNIAILTSADRESLMPFAQIATRIGGALNIVLALLLLEFLH